MVPEYLVEAIRLGGYKGGRALRYLALQAACTDCETFRIAEGLLNITSADVFDYRIFHSCDSLEIWKLLAENFQISKDSAVCAFHRACMKGNKDIAIWLPEKYRLTRDDLFSWGPIPADIERKLKELCLITDGPIPADLERKLKKLCLITDGPKPGVLFRRKLRPRLGRAGPKPGVLFGRKLRPRLGRAGPARAGRCPRA